MPKRNKRGTLLRKCDAMLQMVYTQRYPKCLVCPKPTSEMHHWIPKSLSNYLRYEENNLVPLCGSCHFKHHTQGDPQIQTEILKKKGMMWDVNLQEKRRKRLKLNIGELEEIYKNLNEELDEIKM